LPSFGDCRIVVNEALGRLKRKRREAAFATSKAWVNFEIAQFPLNRRSDDAERTVAQRQILRLVEQAIETLPHAYRVVFVARAIEGLSSEETAQLLGLRSETVRTRLHRARCLVRKKLEDQIGPVLMNAFPFEGRRCKRLIWIASVFQPDSMAKAVFVGSICWRRNFTIAFSLR
jgi:RNA polymerase sigma-70 factor, ECF subfamily